jgi:hypothetical protein
MTTHARPGDSVSAAKLTLYGSIGTALIGAAAVIIVGVMNHPNVATVSTTITPAPSPKSDLVSFNNLQMNGTGRVTVSGFAEEDVNDAAVVVAIGPKPSGGYWFGYGNVLNQHWQADVATDPPWQNYAISAAYYSGLPGGASPAPGSAGTAGVEGNV